MTKPTMNFTKEQIIEALMNELGTLSYKQKNQLNLIECLKGAKPENVTVTEHCINAKYGRYINIDYTAEGHVTSGNVTQTRTINRVIGASDNCMVWADDTKCKGLSLQTLKVYADLAGVKMIKSTEEENEFVRSYHVSDARDYFNKLNYIYDNSRLNEGTFENALGYVMECYLWEISLTYTDKKGKSKVFKGYIAPKDLGDLSNLELCVSFDLKTKLDNMATGKKVAKVFKGIGIAILCVPVIALVVFFLTDVGII